MKAQKTEAKKPTQKVQKPVAPEHVTQITADTHTDELHIIANPMVPGAQGFTQSATADADPNILYPEQIPESKGDHADQANVEIDQEILEKIMQVRNNIAMTEREKKYHKDH